MTTQIPSVLNFKSKIKTIKRNDGEYQYNIGIPLYFAKLHALEKGDEIELRLIAHTKKNQKTVD